MEKWYISYYDSVEHEMKFKEKETFEQMRDYVATLVKEDRVKLDQLEFIKIIKGQEYTVSFELECKFKPI